MHHPEVGDLELHREKLIVAGAEGQVLVIYHADTGTASAQALALLGTIAVSSTPGSSSGAGHRPRRLLLRALAGGEVFYEAFFEIFEVAGAAVIRVFIAEAPVEGMGVGAAAPAGDLHGDAVKLAGCFLGGIDKAPADALPAARGGHDERHDAPPAPLAFQVRDRGHRDDPHHVPLTFGHQGKAGWLAYPQRQAPPDFLGPVIGITQLCQQPGDFGGVARLGRAD
jgi:hypothetical protein